MTICHILKKKGGENMTHTIEDLWNGELAFCEHCGAYDPEANRLVREVARFRDDLLPQLQEGQLEQLQGYIDRTERYTLRMMELAFQDGFSAGVKLLTEGLYHA